MTQELQGPFTKPPTVFRWLWLASLVGFFTLAYFLALTASEADIEAQSPATVSAAAQNEPRSDAADPCGLAAVECSGEAAQARTEPRVIQATVYTYQAVPEQTDATPCVGAMAGVDFCNPPFPIVANNCLPLGTTVAFDFTFTTYTVADRMNPRYGCDVFDVLTDGTNFTLTNEPVSIL